MSPWPVPVLSVTPHPLPLLGLEEGGGKGMLGKVSKEILRMDPGNQGHVMGIRGEDLTVADQLWEDLGGFLLYRLYRVLLLHCQDQKESQR